MGSVRAHLPLLLVLLGVQVQSGDCKESFSYGWCQPGFTSDIYVFVVNSEQLANDRTLGKVHFNDCTGRLTSVYATDDSHFQVKTDGTVTVKRHVKLHDDLKIFTVFALDSNGKTFSTSVAVLNERQDYEHYHGHDGHHHHHHHHHHRKHHRQNHTNSESVPTLAFPRMNPGLHRQKRDWIIPTIKVPENERGPYPKKLVQIKSSEAKMKKVLYSITGNGADHPPVGLFTIERDTGMLHVNKPLDRETQESYTLTAYAVSSDGESVEQPMDLNIHVIDQNDNKPVFTQQVFNGNVPEGVPPGTSVMTVTATDADDPTTDNALLGYSILSQDPKIPSPEMFTINKDTGVISTVASGLDKEEVQTYTLLLQVADMGGNGLTGSATAIISITDMNDNAPQFDSFTYEGSVPENKANYEITRLSVTDKDEAHSSAWTAVYHIIKGNEGGLFNITTDRENNQGILKTAKELDFETADKHILLVTAENLVPFSVATLPTSTTTITVSVLDQNEAPIFSPAELVVEILENLPVGQMITSYPAKDPDKAQNQVVKYHIGSDPANWLDIHPETGIIQSKSQLDRESEFVDKSNKYKALILAYDNGNPSTTGSGTLILLLHDVNDNAPELEMQTFEICNENPVPASLSIIDKDLPPNTSPFTAILVLNSDKNWTAEMQDNNVILNMKYKLDPGTYNINLQLTDAGGKSRTVIAEALVCECKGDHTGCERAAAGIAGIGLPAILAVIGAILLLLILLLVLLLFLRRKKRVKEPPLIPDDNIRGNVYYYDEEGGGEDDQEYDLSQLHRGLDNRPEITRNDVIPTLMPPPIYRPCPANPDEIVNFIDENLKAADNDPTAPPYDSLLVFDFEGNGSEVGSLSSINSSSSGDQDYEYLNNWGPRFKKLADMYRGEED